MRNKCSHVWQTLTSCVYCNADLKLQAAAAQRVFRLQRADSADPLHSRTSYRRQTYCTRHEKTFSVSWRTQCKPSNHFIYYHIILRTKLNRMRDFIFCKLVYNSRTDVLPVESSLYYSSSEDAVESSVTVNECRHY